MFKRRINVAVVCVGSRTSNRTWSQCSEGHTDTQIRSEYRFSASVILWELMRLNVGMESIRSLEGADIKDESTLGREGASAYFVLPEYSMTLI